jgi:hypothetical protein
VGITFISCNKWTTLLITQTQFSYGGLYHMTYICSGRTNGIVVAMTTSIIHHLTWLYLMKLLAKMVRNKEMLWIFDLCSKARNWHLTQIYDNMEVLPSSHKNSIQCSISRLTETSHNTHIMYTLACFHAYCNKTSVLHYVHSYYSDFTDLAIVLFWQQGRSRVTAVHRGYRLKLFINSSQRVREANYGRHETGLEVGWWSAKLFDG